MKIEHIAIWVKDIEKVCEFYRKYFGGVVHPIYHNPAKQFTSRFVTFEDGARLEVMHRPDIDHVWPVTSLQFDMLTLGHAGVQAPRRDTRDRMFASPKPTRFGSAIKICKRIFTALTSLTFHVKHPQGECSAHTCMGIAEPQDVGHEVSKHECLGYAHLSFSVGSKEEVDRLTQQMSCDGIQVVGQPRTTGDGYYESVVLDPEGNRVEITI